MNLYHRPPRIQRSLLAGAVGLVAVLVPTALLLALLLLVKVRLDLTVGVAGAVLAVGTLALAQYRSRRPRTRRVIFLAKSRSSFARNIYRGLIDGLEGYGDIHVAGRFPAEGVDGAIFQLEKLKSLEIARAHAVVVIPALEHDEIWHDLARLMSERILVVCVDTKPPNDEFTQKGVAPPLFVGSDFTHGGQLVGNYLVRELKASLDAHLIVAVGPEASWPARERASRILYELARAGLLKRCETVALKDWVAPSCAARLVESIERVIAGGSRVVFVFAGNDKLAHELDCQLERHHEHVSTADVRVIGYDGTTNDDGTSLLGGLLRAVATVDAVPYEQGKAAAEFIAASYEGHIPHLRKRIVHPRLVDVIGTSAVLNSPTPDP